MAWTQTNIQTAVDALTTLLNAQTTSSEWQATVDKDRAVIRLQLDALRDVHDKIQRRYDQL